MKYRSTLVIEYKKRTSAKEELFDECSQLGTQLLTKKNDLIIATNQSLEELLGETRILPHSLSVQKEYKQLSDGLYTGDLKLNFTIFNTEEEFLRWLLKILPRLDPGHDSLLNLFGFILEGYFYYGNNGPRLITQALLTEIKTKDHWYLLLEVLLTRGFKLAPEIVQIEDEKGDTLLHQMARIGAYWVFWHLVAHYEADLFKVNQDKETPWGILESQDLQHIDDIYHPDASHANQQAVTIARLIVNYILVGLNEQRQGNPSPIMQTREFSHMEKDTLTTTRELQQIIEKQQTTGFLGRIIRSIFRRLHVSADRDQVQFLEQAVARSHLRRDDGLLFEAIQKLVIEEGQLSASPKQRHELIRYHGQASSWPGYGYQVQERLEQQAFDKGKAEGDAKAEEERRQRLESNQRAADLEKRLHAVERELAAARAAGYPASSSPQSAAPNQALFHPSAAGKGGSEDNTHSSNVQLGAGE